MVEAIKSGLLSSVGPISSQKLSTASTDGGSFGDFFKADMKGFLNKANDVEGMMTNYAGGVGNIEQIAPMLKELMLEFEVKTKIISSLANILKTLTSMNI
jgi:hypothetical protein